MLVEEATFAERLFLWRHRLNVPRGDAARRLGISPARYADFETGRLDVKTWDSAYDVLVDHILPREHFVLIRRREKLSLQDIADAIGCTRQLVSQMERGRREIRKLQEFWRQV